MCNHEKNQVTLECIKTAAERIKPFVHNTPILTSTFLDKETGRNLYFKCENFQKSGSFKIRGATNSILKIKEQNGGEPFIAVTCSSGNLGQGLACAAAANNVRSLIVVPNTAPQVKKDSIIEYGAALVECAATPTDIKKTIWEVMDELKGMGQVIYPSGPSIIEGQGTVGLEMLEQIPDLDAAIFCCSSGGLLAGAALALKRMKPYVRVFGAEPMLCDSTARSMKEGRRILHTEYPETIADGLKGNIGEYAWPIIRDNVEDIITVTEDEITHAMYLLWERMKIVVEPSGAVPLAAALTEQFKSLSKDVKNIGVFVSGGNADLTRLPWIVEPQKYNRM